jgi:hypothetical protein
MVSNKQVVPPERIDDKNYSESQFFVNCNCPISSQAKVETTSPQRKVHVISQDEVQQTFWLEDCPDDSSHNAAHHDAAKASNQVTQNS